MDSISGDMADVAGDAWVRVSANNVASFCGLEVEGRKGWLTKIRQHIHQLKGTFRMLVEEIIRSPVRRP